MRRSSNHGHHHDGDAEHDNERTPRSPIKGRHHLTSEADESRPYPGVPAPAWSAADQAALDQMLGLPANA